MDVHSILSRIPGAASLVPGLTLLVLLAASTSPRLSAQTASAVAEPISANDNRVAAGTLNGTALSLALEAREGRWFPDGLGKPGVVVRAFAEQGKALQVPGPLVRVTEGTTIRLSMRNTLSQPLTLHGMHSRGANPGTTPDATLIPAGETGSLQFVAGKPGTYYYWAARDAATALADRDGADSQLTGAIVVDPRDAAIPSDRVLLITNWVRGQTNTAERRNRFAINGRSWPETERLTYAVGDTVRMRVINAGGGVHPMHLHGFYFNVDSRGNNDEDSIFPPDASPRMVVTERLIPGNTFSLTWKPTRPGNWLFHCHDNVHLDHGGPLDDHRPAAPIAHLHPENHALEMMAGPVMGITVTGRSTEAPEPAGLRRQLRLVARVDEGGTAAEPAFGYSLHEGVQAPDARPRLPGPTLLLKRGEPVSITVENRLTEPTAVHWHGIELESYFDGVAGYAGEGTRVAPAIAPGGSFEARFTPPRAGTFIYHTHLDDTRQQQAGLSGPLLVVDDPASFDPARDIVLMISVPRKNGDSAKVLINGSLAPDARQLRVGQRYRLRFINIHTFRPSMRMRLLRGDGLLTWRSLAKDGMDLPGDQRRETASEVQMGNGETYDFEFVPTTPGDMRLDVAAGNGTLLASMPIRVS